MDNLRRLELIENVPRARYYLRDLSNPLEDLQDIEFHQRFRFSKDTVLSILEMIRDDITPLSDRDANIPPMLKLFNQFEIFCYWKFSKCHRRLIEYFADVCQSNSVQCFQGNCGTPPYIYYLSNRK